MPGTLLAIGAHYDDCVFGIPGIMLKAVRKHYRVVILSLIGDYTNWAPVGKGRAQELIDGTKRLSKDYGVEMRYLGYRSMAFQADDEAKRAAAEVVAEVQPEIAFLLWPLDRHPDHESASQISKIALQHGGAVLGRPVRNPRRIYQFDNGPRHTIGFEPDTFVDVTEEWPAAIEWLGRFMALVRKEEYNPKQLDSAQESKQALASYRGKASGVKFSEALKAFVAYPAEIL